MSLIDDAQNILGAVPLGTNKEPSVRQHTTILDNTGTIQPKMGRSRIKLIESNGMVESYEYQHSIWFGKRSEKFKLRCKKTKERNKHKKSIRSEEYRGRTIIRAMNTLRRLIYLNFTERDKFITLTLNNVQDFNINSLKECLPYYQKFIRKLRIKYPGVKYITVPEFQKRGAVHYHVLCNIPYIHKTVLRKLWPYGFSYPEAIHGTTHLSLYLTKYLSKRFDDKRTEGHRLFYSSRGLKKPTVTYAYEARDLVDDLKKYYSDDVQYESKWTGKYCGDVKYSQYILEKS